MRWLWDEVVRRDVSVNVKGEVCDGVRSEVGGWGDEVGVRTR